MKRASILLLIGLILANSQGVYKLVWSDEFDGTEVDLTKWQFEQNCNVQNAELECYTSRKDNAVVKNGVLSIIAKPESYGNKQYTSARLNTAKTASWLYGKFEMSAKLPKGKHLWPAFWMLPTDYKYGAWAASGEIDIMEYRGQVTDQTQGTLHYGGAWPNNAHQGSGPVSMGMDLSAAYHNYTIEWERDEIRWYFDSKMFYKQSLVKNFYSGRGTNPYTTTRQPFDQPFHFVINLAVGGNFFNGYGTLTAADAAAWPDNSFDIDWIRAYQLNANVPATTTPPKTSTPVPRVSTTATPKTSSVIKTSAQPVNSQTDTTDNGGDPIENVVQNDQVQQSSGKKIMGMTKPVVGIVFGVAGLLLIVIVIVIVVFIRRRATRLDTMSQTELAVPQ